MQRTLKRPVIQQIIGLAVAELAYVGLLAILLSIIWFQDRYSLLREFGLANRSSAQSQTLNLIVGVIALSPSLVFLIALIRQLVPRDEMQRSIDREALAIASIGAITFASFNQAAGLLLDQSAQGLFPWFLILPVMGVAWCSGQIICHLRYSMAS